MRNDSKKTVAILVLATSLILLGPLVLERWSPPSQGQEVVTRRFPQFENDRVRVWKTIIMPDQPLEMHRHDYGRVVVALKGGTLMVVPEEGQPTLLEWETGNAYWLDADPPDELHGDVNEGDEPIEVMVIEIRSPME